MYENILTVTQELERGLEVNKNLELSRQQNQFLQSTLEQSINRGLDLGIRAILPGSLGNRFMDVRNALVQEGLNTAVRDAISQTIEFGRNAVGFVRETFRNISEARRTIDRGDLTNNLSSNLDNVLKKAEENNRLDKELCKCFHERKRINYHYC